MFQRTLFSLNSARTLTQFSFAMNLRVNKYDTWCTCRVPWEDYEMTCMHAVMRHGSMMDKLVYTGAMSAHKLLCEDKKQGAIITRS